MEALILSTLIGIGIGIILPGRQRTNSALSDQINNQIAELERKVNLLWTSLGNGFDGSPDQNDLLLEAVPANRKIKVIKLVRRLTSLDLKATKDLVELTPSLIPALNTDIFTAKNELEAAGAAVSLKSGLAEYRLLEAEE